MTNLLTHWLQWSLLALILLIIWVVMVAMLVFVVHAIIETCIDYHLIKKAKRKNLLKEDD